MAGLHLLEISRASLDCSVLFLALLGCATTLLTARAVRAPHRIERPVSQEPIELVAATLAALAIPMWLTTRPIDLVAMLALVLATGVALCLFVRRLSLPGVLTLATQAVALVVGPIWGALFIVEADLPLWLELAALATLGLGMMASGVTLVAGFAREAVMTHEDWRMPAQVPEPCDRAPRFKVSLHLPCYAEPPEVVKATMDGLAGLDYADFEVLVCDNNTQDETLWRPLEAHCAVLNRRLGREVFRFFHVAPLPGAKAGALNFCLEQMAPDTEVVGVIDADYHSRPDFLSRLVPFFAGPRIGYIQTPHDYRGYEDSDFLTACHWEYMPTNKVDYPGVSEYGGAFTIGTMCLLRAEALRRAGGWAEWCLTEDSEVSVRIRAVGYRGLYFGETFGRGLIPETFDDYRKQRFRWTAGPVQQLRRHWRLFRPAPLAAPLPGWSKLLEVTRCVSPLLNLAGIAMAVLSAVGIAITVISDNAPRIAVPEVTWLLLVVGVATWIVRTVHRYRLSGCDDPRAMIRGEIARASLDYVVLLAGVAGLSKRPIAWRRTPKFAVQSAQESPFVIARGETVAGVICLAIALLALLAAGQLGGGFALLLGLSFATMALRFFCAPVMAALGNRHATRVTAVPVPEPRPLAA
ncbi:glycosyltransferase family 2 protein [Novosphingobium sp. PS1R-30]|uniref:Glycosyltransferase family 2 protein n=1 Tax=Novosphingobium anseongense TaxID=3133436 RepID=A0ABU8RW93_9SPHN